MNPFPMRDYNQTSLVKRVIELEGRGFECIVPIRERYRVTKDFKMKNSSNVEGGFAFDGASIDKFYTCVMKKVEEENAL